MHDGPFEEAMQHPEEMVVTAWPGAWSGLEEVFDQNAIDRTPSHRGVLTKVSVEQSQSGSLRPVLAVQGLLVLHERADRLGQGAMETGNDSHSSSPLPMATSRNALMATFE